MAKTIEERIAAGERGIPRIPDGPGTRHAIYPGAITHSPDYRSRTPPPWVASDRAQAHADKEHECRDTLRRLALDLATMSDDWDRQSLTGIVPHHLRHCGDALRAVLRRYGLL